MARMVIFYHPFYGVAESHVDGYRAVEQAGGGKVVGVDPAVVTACKLGWSSENSYLYKEVRF